MEALSLLKYWRSSSNLSPTTTLRCPPTTVLSTLSDSDSDSDDYIDLDFTILTNPKLPHQQNSLFYKGPLLPTKSRIFPRTSDEAPRRSGDGGRRFVMDVYRTKIKPLYVKVSRRADGGEVGRKRLGKCRSASAVVAPAPARRRDDSLLVMEDGIQSAIAHCKRSFNGTRDSDSALARSKSDSYDERSACVEKRKQEFASD